MDVTIVGAGLAGTECAFQLAERGVQVTLIEQKPKKRTPAQNMDYFAELVCSNSLRGMDLANAVGLLKEEMRRAGSLVIQAADQAKVPAGRALAVDRDSFSGYITHRVTSHSRITVEAREVMEVPTEGRVVLATGPLTGDALAHDLANIIGETHLAYYDAIAPVVAADSINWDRVFRASRYDKGGDDAYVNCPFDEKGYKEFVAAVIAAEKVVPRDFEDIRYFEGCLPLEVMAERGEQTLSFGPMKPVGLTDPKTGQRPFAVVQLRQEDHAASAYNLVGFQTRMKWPDQKRVFRMIPGLEEAEFVRMGSVHRNTFVHSPEVLSGLCELSARPGVHLAGQMTGVEGYVESAASGLVIGAILGTHLRTNQADPSRSERLESLLPAETTALGGLIRYVQTPRKDFQPSNVVWNMVPPLVDAPKIRGRRSERKRKRHGLMSERALEALDPWLDQVGARLVRTQVQEGARVVTSAQGVGLA